MTGEPSAAVRYKELVGLARKAAEDLRAWELARADELTGQIAAAREQVAAAEQREQVIDERVARWWKMATDSVSRLSWFEAGAEPEPVSSARAGLLDRYSEDVRPAYQELTQAILKLGWRAR